LAILIIREKKYFNPTLEITIPITAISVSFQLTDAMIKTVAIMKNADLRRTERLVVRPYCKVSTSEEILDMTSPVLLSSKKVTSLRIRYQNKSYLTSLPTL